MAKDKAPSLQELITADALHNLREYHAPSQSLAVTNGPNGLLVMMRNIAEAVNAAITDRAASPELLKAALAAVDDLFLEYVIPVNWPIPDFIEPQIEEMARELAKWLVRGALSGRKPAEVA